MTRKRPQRQHALGERSVQAWSPVVVKWSEIWSQKGRRHNSGLSQGQNLKEGYHMMPGATQNSAAWGSKFDD
jgi:hypothetical protein